MSAGKSITPYIVTQIPTAKTKREHSDHVAMLATTLAIFRKKLLYLTDPPEQSTTAKGMTATPALF